MPFFDLQKIVQGTLSKFVSNFVKQKGSPNLTSNPKKVKRGEKPETNNGIDMGIQVEPGIVPVVYGLIGMSNTQFDLGSQPSEHDTTKVTQRICIPVAEGPIVGISCPGNVAGVRDPDDNFFWWYSTSDSRPGTTETDLWKSILINDNFVMDNNGVVSQTDVEFTMTRGGGSSDNTWQSAKIGDRNPLLDEEVEEPEDTKFLNDLGDVEAGKGVDYVLYWNHDTDRWEAKSFSDLLQNAFDNRNSTGGDSSSDTGDGTTGQDLKGDDAKNASNGIKYTQWNPPPHEICWPDDVEPIEDTTQTVEYTKPPKPDTGIVNGLGAALQDLDCPTPYFITELDFADVEYPCQLGITLHFAMPDGLYQEITTTEHIKNARGKFKMRDTTRPIENAGNLLCLDPENIEISDDGYTYTTRVREHATVEIGYMFTTEICGREFVLDEGTRVIGNSKLLGRKYETEYFAFSSMNAGRGYDDEPDEKAGTQQIGSIKDPGDCNADDVLYYDFDDYELIQYLNTYPKQIITKGNKIKAYVWINEKTINEEYKYSTAVYLSGIEVCDEFTVFTCDYYKAQSNIDRYILNPPDHRYLWQNWKHDWWERVGRTLKDGRLYSTISGGVYSATPGPSPLMIMDYCPEEGTTVGDVVFPPGESIPYARMETDGLYAGDAGKDDLVQLPPWEVTYADTSETLDLTITVDSGVLDLQDARVVIIGQGTDTLTVTGTVTTLTGALDNVYWNSQNSTGDVPISSYISAPNGRNSRTDQLIKSSECVNAAPSFTIDICGTEGAFRPWTTSGKALLSTTLNFDGTETEEQIATEIAAEITSYAGNPDWDATADGSLITVTGPEVLGDTYNGLIPYNNPTNIFNNDPLCATFSPVKGGCGKPVKSVTEKKPVVSGVNAPVIPQEAFDKTKLTADTKVAWFDMKYRPRQDGKDSELSEVGLYVGGKTNMEEPNSPYDTPSYTFDQWKDEGYRVNGTFNKDYVVGLSSNSAWVFFDYLTNDCYGLYNDIIKPLSAEQKECLYKDIYCAAAWCYYLPTGNDEIWASRFDGLFYGAESKFEALQKIADRFHGKLVYINGNPRLIWDGKGHVDLGSECNDVAIKKLVNQANTANTTYNSGSLGNLYNVINVKYNDPHNYYKLLDVQFTNVRPEHSESEIGRRETTVEISGCTSKQGALWYAAWMYETEATESDMISYTAGWDHWNVEPGDLIHVVDTLRPDRESIKGGRACQTSDPNILQLDRDYTGSIAVTTRDGSIVQGTASNGLATVPTDEYVDGCIWNAYDTELKANYKVIAVEESEDGIFSVTAQKRDPDKYTRIWANTI